MTSAAVASKAFGRPRLSRFVSLVFLILACFALPQQAAAQNSADITVSGQTITITIDDAEVTEGSGTAGFVVTAEPALPMFVGIPVRYAAGSAGLEDLGSGRPGSLSLLMNDSSVTVEVPIVDDNLLEPEETFTVFLDTTGGTIQATGTIIDDEKRPQTSIEHTFLNTPHTITVTDAIVVEGSPAVFDVTIEPPLPNTANFRLTFTNDTTQTGDIFSLPTAFATGTTGTASFAAPTDDDEFFERDETFTVTVGVATGVTLQATGTIVDNDTPPMGALLRIDPVTVDENVSGGNAVFTATLSESISTQVFANFAVAAAGANPVTVAEDLGTLPSTSVTISGGGLSTTFSVPIMNDNVVEGDETFEVTITTNTEDVTVIYGGKARGTITDDDMGEVTLDPLTSEADEEDGTFEYTVSLDAPVDEAVGVTWTASAESDDDATVADDLQTPITGDLIFTPKDTEDKTFSIAVMDDMEDEPDETFTVTLTPTDTLPAGVTIPAATSSSKATILDDDGGEAVSVSVNSASAPEGDDVRFTVTLSDQLLEPRTLNILYRNGSTRRGDLSDDRPTTLTLPIGTLRAHFDVPTNQDDFVEDDELFIVALELPDPPPENPKNTLTILSTFTTIPPSLGTIRNDDIANVTIADQTKVENEAFRFRITTRSARLANGLTMNYAVTDGSATVADDLNVSPVSGTITLPAPVGDAFPEVFLDIPIEDDDFVERDETFTVTLTPVGSSPPAGVVFPRGAVGTIEDNDMPTGPTISIEPVTVAEGGGNAVFTATLSAPASTQVGLNVAVTPGPGDTNQVTVADDLGNLPPGVTFVGTVRETITVPITDDDFAEGDETFTVTITAARGTDGYTIIHGGMATGTITDDDGPGLVSLSPTMNSAAENGSFDYTVRLSAPTDEAVNLTWTASAELGNDATVADDLRVTTGTVAFTADDMEDKTFSIRVNDDNIDERDETFTVTLTPTDTLPAGVTIPTATSRSTATITDNDTTTGGTVSIAPVTVAENVSGRNAVFTVTLSQTVSTQVALNIAVTPGKTNPVRLADDLGRLPTEVVVTTGLTETFMVPITNDNLVEGDETFTVTISESNLPEGFTIIYGGEATGTITDDDMGKVTLDPLMLTAAENASFEYTVSLDKAAEDAVNVTWTASAEQGNTAAVRDDLQAPITGDLIFMAGEKDNQTFSIAVNDDDLIEPNETFTVTLTPTDTLPAGVTIPSATGSSAATITDNDSTDPTASIHPVTVVENVSGGAATFSVTLSAAQSTDVIFNVAVTAGGGTNPVTVADDLGRLGGLVTISEGNRSGGFTVPIIDDEIVEGDETFTVTITPRDVPAGLTISTGAVTGTITDDDMGQVTLNQRTLTAAENGSFEYTVSLDKAADEAVNVTWTASAESGDTAVVADDLQRTTGTVTFMAGEKDNQTFTIAVNDDMDDEENETFTVTLTPTGTLPTGVTIPSATSSSKATITDNDVADPMVSIAPVTVVENVSGGVATFTVSLSKAATTGVELNVAVAAGDTNPVTLADDLGDLTDLSNDGVTIGFGDLSETFTVPINDDEIVEGNETFKVTISLGNNAGVVLGNSVATGTITDDDMGEVSLSPPMLTAAEDGTFEYTVNLDNAADEAVNVTWTASAESGDTAVVADDLEAPITGTVTFMAGEKDSQTFSIAVNDDITDEQDETFTVTLTPTGTLPTGVTIPTAGSRSTATIADDDENSIDYVLPERQGGTTHTITIADAEVTEGAGPARFAITIDPALTVNLSVGVSYTAGSASLEDLESSRTESISIQGTDTSVTLEVPITDDDLVEGEETFTVSLNTGDGGIIHATGTIIDNDSADPTVRIAPRTVAENVSGGVATFTVSLSKAATTGVELNVAVAAGDTNPVTLADDLGDLTDLSNDGVTIGFGDLSETFTVPINDDEIVEGNETFKVTISLGNNAGVVLGNSVATGTITDDDMGEVSLSPPMLTAAEDGTFEYTVNLDNAADEAVNVTWTASAESGDTAVVADDLEAPITGTVTFMAGEKDPQTFSIAVNDDDLVEENETFTVTLTPTGTLPTGVTIPSATSSSKATITDNDVAEPTVSIAPVTVVENVSGGVAVFTASLSAVQGTGTVLNVAVTAGGGTNPVTVADDLGDLTDLSNNGVTIARGDLSQTFRVPITNDEIVEGDETFTVTITANDVPLGLTIGTGVVTGTITDDDMGEVSLSPPTPTAAENGSFEYTVSLSAAADAAVDVTWTASAESGDTAVVADDLEAPITGTVTFMAGEKDDRTFTITVNDDNLVEPNETFTVTLTPTGTLPTGVTIPSAGSSSKATITDNDTAAGLTASIAARTVAEDVSGGGAVFTVTLSAVQTTDVNFNVAVTAGAGTNPVTLVDDLGALGDLPTRVDIVRGNLTGNFTVPINDDEIVEGDETFTVTITTRDVPAGLTIGTGVVTGTITDDDMGEVSLSPPTPTAAENGTFEYTVSLSAAADEAVNVTWTASTESGDNAVVADDLEAPITGTVTFMAGEKDDRTFTIAVNDDDLVEPNETFTVTLTPTGTLPTGVTIPSAGSSSKATITDNDTAAGLTASIAARTVAEDVSGGGAVFTVTLSAVQTTDVNFNVAVTAGAGTNPVTLVDDLGALGDLPTRVDIVRGNLTGNFTVPINDDEIVEGDETFTVTITTRDVPAGLTIGTGVVTGTITDDDMGEVSLSPPTPTAAENGSFEYTVSLSAAADEAVNVTWTASTESGDNAVVADDLEAPTTGTVTFMAGEKDDRTFTIAVNDDDLVEPNETFTVTLTPTGTLPTGVTIPSAGSSSKATITDNDTAAGLTASIAARTVAEDVSGGGAVFTVTLSAVQTTDVNFNVAVTAGAGTNPVTLVDDLGALGDLPTRVDIVRGNLTGNFTVPINDDEIVEGDETFTVTITTRDVPAGLTIGTGVVTGTITDDDMGQVTLNQRTLTAAENGTFEYTVSLDNAADEAVNVTWTASAESGDTAVVADDLEAPITGTVTFMAGEKDDQTFTITVNDDMDDEENETFTVTLTPTGTLPTGVTIPSATSSSKATITDNDTAAGLTASIAARTVAENVSGNAAVFSVALSAVQTTDVTFNVAVTAGGTNSVTLADDLGTLPTRATIDRGNLSGDFTVPINDDEIVEGTETFTVTITPRDVPAGLTISTGVVTGTITDDDRGRVSLSPAANQAAENGSFNYIVRLDKAADEAVNVTWTASVESGNTATVTTDLQRTTGTVTFMPNDRADKPFSIPVTNDTAVEPNETFTVTLSATGALPTGVTIPTATRRSTATILDNDDPVEAPVEATVSIANATAAENAVGGAVGFTVSLSRAVNSDVTLAVVYARGRTNPATPADDLGTARPTGVTIREGNLSATLTVPITNDGLVEGDETFTVTLREDPANRLPTGVTIGAGNEATGTITDDDRGLVSLSPATLSAAEGGVFTYTVRLDAAADEAVNVTWTATTGVGDTATVAADLRETTGTVRFPANDNADKTFTIRTAVDTANETDETFTVTIAASPTRPLPTGVTVDPDKAASAATITFGDGSAVAAVSIADAAPVAEGAGPARFTVSLTRAVDSDVVLAVAYAGGPTNPARPGIDHRREPATVTIRQGETSATFSVGIYDDDIVEGDETFTVTISVPSGRPLEAVAVDDGVATGTILAGDTATVSLRPTAVVPTTEGVMQIFTVELDNRVAEAFSLGWEATGISASPTFDLGARTGTVDIPARSRRATFRILARDDGNDSEGRETYRVSLTTPAAPMGLVAVGTNQVMIDGQRNSATGTIEAGPAGPAVRHLVISDSSPVVEGSGNAQFRIGMYESDNSTPATVSEDFTLNVTLVRVFDNVVSDVRPPTSLLWPANVRATGFGVTIVDDDIVEDGEAFAVRLSPGGPLPDGVIIADGLGKGSIIDNDAARVSLSPATLSAAEDGSFSYTVRLGAPVDRPVHVTWTATSADGDTAMVDDDLQETTGRVSFAALDTAEKTFTIRPVDDPDYERDETFTVTLTPTGTLPGGVTIDRGRSAATITDNDESAAARVRIADARVDEDMAGATADFTISLTNPVDSDLTLAVTYAAGTATPTEDLGAGRPTTLTIPANRTTATLAVPITDDDIVEGAETFTVTLGEDPANRLPVSVILTGTEATGTITEDDEALISLSPTVPTEITEGGSFTYTVRLNAPVDEAIDLTWSALGILVGVDGEDLEEAHGTVRFAANDAADKTFTIRPVEDRIDEPNETFTVYLFPTAPPSLFRPSPFKEIGSLPAGVTIDPYRNTSTATITDNDAAVMVRIADATVDEDMAGAAAAFTVSLDRAVDSDVTLAVTYGAGSADPATPAADLGADRPARVTIPADETSATVTVPILDDAIVEGAETFTVTVSEDPANRLPAGVIITDNEATGTITEDDRALLSLWPATHQTIEGGTFRYTVRLSAPVGEAFDVGWFSGAGAGDVDETRGTVRFEANDTADRTFTIRTVADDLDEPHETFSVAIAGPAGGLPVGVRIDYANYSSTATILDGAAGAWVSIADATVDENVAGGTVAFTVSLSRAVDSDVTLDVSYADGSATLVDDLLAGWPDRVTIAEGNDMADISLLVKNDGFVEGDETFTVTVRESRAYPLPADVIFLDRRATGTITDDDTALVSLSPTTAPDRTTIAFRAGLSNPLTEDLALGWTATVESGAGAAAADPLSGTVTVRAGDRSASITIDAVGLPSGGTLTVRLSDAGLPPRVQLDDRRDMATHQLRDLGRVSIANADPVAEGAGPALFTVSLSRAVADDVWLLVAYEHRSASWQDLGNPRPASVLIAEGKTSAILSVPIIDDDIVEGRESFTVTISEDPLNPLPAGVSIADGTATGTITDEGGPVSVLVSLSPSPTREGTVIVFGVDLTNPLEADLALGWTATVEPGANPRDDQDPLTGTVTVPEGDLSAPLMIDTAGLPPGRFLTVRLSDAGLPPDVLLDADGITSGDIIPGPGSASAASVAAVSIEDADPVAAGAGPARFMVSLSRSVDSDVVLNVGYGVSNGAGSAALADLGSARPASVTITMGATEATLDVPIVDDVFAEGEETFTVTLTMNTAPDGVIIADGSATGTITQSRGPSVLIEPRRIGAGTALRRHVRRFDSLTGTVVRNRLTGSGTHDLSLSAEVTGDGQDVTVSSQPFTGSWGTWIDGAWAGIDGNASGRQADIHAGVDYLGSDWLIGALIGYELADLDIDEATFRSNYLDFGLYGGARLSEHLLFDGALAYGTATPELDLGGVSGSYDAQRFTVRGALTGNFDLETGQGTGQEAGSLRIEPQLGLLYSSETLGAFTDSADRVAEREVLEIGRLTAGPRLTGDFDGGQFTGGARLQWDFLGLDDGVGGKVSAAAEIGLRLELGPGATFGIHGDVDGIGIGDDFRSIGGRFEFGVRF